MNHKIEKVKSGVRLDAKFNLIHAIRRRWVTKKCGRMGKQVYVDKNVKILRYPQNVSIGNNVMLKEGARICSAQTGSKISIGDWTTIGYHTYIFASTGITIGQNCLIAPFCYFVDSNHGIKKNLLIREQQMSIDPITIGDDVWLGSRVTVLKGVRIGKGAVIGAGSVVQEDIPEFTIATGNPLKLIGVRK